MSLATDPPPSTPPTAPAPAPTPTPTTVSWEAKYRELKQKSHAFATAAKAQITTLQSELSTSRTQMDAVKDKTRAFVSEQKKVREGLESERASLLVKVKEAEEKVRSSEGLFTGISTPVS